MYSQNTSILGGGGSIIPILKAVNCQQLTANSYQINLSIYVQALPAVENVERDWLELTMGYFSSNDISSLERSLVVVGSEYPIKLIELGSNSFQKTIYYSAINKLIAVRFSCGSYNDKRNGLSLSDWSNLVKVT